MGLWVFTVLVRDGCPYLVFFDKVLNRFTQVDHQRFQDAFSSDGDVHCLIKNSYN